MDTIDVVSQQQFTKKGFCAMKWLGNGFIMRSKRMGTLCSSAQAAPMYQ